MTIDVHHGDGSSEPADSLLDAVRRVAPRWLERVTVTAAARGGITLTADDDELSTVVDAAVAQLVTELAALLATDVDEQRTNPLSLFRRATVRPTAFLLARGARPPTPDRFAEEHFPDDVFHIGPASWIDVDPELHEPGITWGAWKAMTVLRRRRDEGLR